MQKCNDYDEKVSELNKEWKYANMFFEAFLQEEYQSADRTINKFNQSLRLSCSIVLVD